MKRTKTRLLAGSNGIALELPAKIAKVGVALAAMVVVTPAAAGATHAPVAGLVWHRLRLIGKLVPPVSALAVIVSALPTLTVATANAPYWLDAEISTMPGSPEATSATISGTGVVEADRLSVLIPTYHCAGPNTLAQVKAK